MPYVRGRIIPEVQSVGRAKKRLDILFWLKNADNARTLKTLDELEHLRIYLGALEPHQASIRSLIPLDDKKTNAAMKAGMIECDYVSKSSQLDIIPKRIRETLNEDLAVLAATALTVNVDCIVTDEMAWLPYIEEFEELGIFLTTPGRLLLHYCEVFVRGYDIPWAFDHKVWFEAWTAFYQLSEPSTFKQGMELLNLAGAKNAAAEAREIGRSLVLNRLGDLCFTRDRLLFYDIQKSVARRAGWKRQRFSAEVAYYLNFYYLLLFGAFDHAAVFVNALLNLGVKEKRVAARNQEFLAALQAKAPKLHAVFDSQEHKSFIGKVAAVRHVAAHRGVITPTKVVQEPDHEPTNDELDEDIRQAGLEEILLAFPAGEAREGFRAMLRTNAKMARYEQETLMEDVVLVEIDGKWGWINPLLDTSWNFNCCMRFLEDVFAQCTALLT